MLTKTERAEALAIVLTAQSPEDFPAVNDRLCRDYPDITTEDLIVLHREAGDRRHAEARELERFLEQRRKAGSRYR